MEQKNYPKIRFPDFEDDWQEYSMEELYTERKEQGNDSLPILTVSIHSGISDGELDEDNMGRFVRRSEDKTAYKHVCAGDLVFNMMRAWQGAIGSDYGVSETTCRVTEAACRTTKATFSECWNTVI